MTLASTGMMSGFSGGNSSRRFGVCVCVCYDTKVCNDIIIMCVCRHIAYVGLRIPVAYDYVVFVLFVVVVVVVVCSKSFSGSQR